MRLKDETTYSQTIRYSDNNNNIIKQMTTQNWKEKEEILLIHISWIQYKQKPDFEWQIGVAP